jgi:hypothetical protein
MLSHLHPRRDVTDFANRLAMLASDSETGIAGFPEGFEITSEN